MKKPEKFNTFCDALMKEARRRSLVDVAYYWGIDEKELDECTDFLEKIKQEKDLEVPVRA